ncbi:MAG: ATP-binding protein [Thermodesulfovibrio sp.]|nr:ATP-binding protein [Thermodesulfovibrio sp.]
MEDISLHILDIAENSVAAGATVIAITLVADEDRDILTLKIDDNGRGIPAEILGQVMDPFYTTRTTRKTGFGLSLLSQSAREADGDILITSAEGKGTQISAYFRSSHVDRKPLGNLADTFSVLIAGNPDIDFIITCSLKGKECQLDTRLLRADLEEVPLNAPDVIAAIRKYLKKALTGLN